MISWGKPRGFVALYPHSVSDTVTDCITEPGFTDLFEGYFVDLVAAGAILERFDGCGSCGGSTGEMTESTVGVVDPVTGVPSATEPPVVVQLAPAQISSDEDT